MIPVRLELHNFLPYRSPDPLYFEGIHLACLTGHNGAGKSSILDAITWVLWGRARSKRDDDLVHLGQVEMHVQLDFEQEGLIYRVIRKRKVGKRGQGQGDLNLYIIQPDGSITLISEPSMRETEARINDILRLDYETFVNSSFLQQGKADAFTTKTPAERKRILGDILGLEQWAVYEERTKEKLKEIDSTLGSLRSAIQLANDELAKEPQLKRELESAQRSYDIAKTALAEAEQRRDEVKEAPANLRLATDQLNAVKRRIQEREQDLRAVEKDMADRLNIIGMYQAVIEQAETIEVGYQALQNANQANSELGTKLRDLSDLERRQNSLTNELTQIRNRLEQEINGYQTIINEAQRILTAYNADDLATIQATIAQLENADVERNALHEEISNLKEERSALNSTKETLAETGKELNERILALESADAICPLCGQPLHDEHRTQILQDVTDERDAKRDEYRNCTARIQAIAEEITNKQQTMNALGDQLAELPKLRVKAGGLQKQADDAALAQQRIDDATSAKAQIEQLLETEDYGGELRIQLEELEQKRQDIGYDRDAHDNIQSTLDQFRGYEKEHSRLQVARETLPREESALDSAKLRKDRLLEFMAEESAERDTLQAQMETLQMLADEFKRREGEVQAQRTAERQANEKVTIAEQQLGSIERQRERKRNYEERRDTAEQEQSLYKDLQLAFGKNGVPAMIIESAIPELESAANELLTRMTDGRMHLRLTTQREKVSGGVTETLDIEIADDLGTRPYEMYSGGEAFRINFAIRIALSKMLARRAGAQLRTLFIDEGFGTQDGDGRDKLVEAINTIQNDFDLLLVITHIDELRDAFPVHIVVEKTANGSRVSVQ